MEGSGEGYHQSGEPGLDVVSAYQKRVRKLRLLLLIETCVCIPVIVVLIAILVMGSVERGQMGLIRFGTALEIAIEDEDMAYQVLDQYKTESGHFRLPSHAIAFEPLPQVTTTDRGDTDPLGQMEAHQILKDAEAKGDFAIVTDAEILFVGGEPLIAAPPDGVIRKAIDALTSRYASMDNMVGPPKVCSEYDIVPERRHPSRLRYSADELVAEFDREAETDTVERIGPGTTVDSISAKHGLSRQELQTRNRNLDLSSTLPDGTAILVRPGRDEFEVEYQLREQHVTTVPAPVRQVDDPELEKGTTEVESEGKEGAAQVTYRITYRNDREVGWVVSEQIMAVEPVERVVRVGTKDAESEAGE